MNAGRNTLIFGVLFYLTSVAATAQSAEDAWRHAFKQCGRSELSGRKVLFFGTSNTTGIGSVWRKPDSGGGYNLRFDLPKLIPDAAKRASVISLGTAPTECSGTHTGGLALALSLPFLQVFSNQTGFSANWSNAKNTAVTVDKISFDQLVELEFENTLTQLGSTNPDDVYYRDTTVKGRLVMNKAFRVSGVTLTANYTPDQLKDLKTKYPEGGSVNVGGDKGATVSFSYSNVNTLTLKASGDIYIAGEFAKIEGGRMALNGNATSVPYRLIPVESRGVIVGRPEEVR